MAKVYVAAYFSYADLLKELTEAERGRLFSALLEYGETGAEPELWGNERFVWPAIKGQIDRDNANYTKVVERNRNNGAKGGRPEKHDNPQETQKTQSVFDKPQKPKTDKEKEKENVKEREINPPIAPPEGAGAVDEPQPETSFDRFWAAYPRKVGKGAAKKAFAKVKAPLATLLSALAEQKKSDMWTKDGGQFIPHPATWLNQERWEDAVTIEIEKPPDIHGSPAQTDEERRAAILAEMERLQREREEQRY